MITKIRENMYLADAKVTAAEMTEVGATMVLIVDANVSLPTIPELVYFRVNLDPVKINRPHVKDIACHIPKYMTQNGEKIVVVDETGLHQSAFVVARAICELEDRSLFEVMTEMKEIYPELDLGKMYL